MNAGRKNNNKLEASYLIVHDIIEQLKKQSVLAAIMSLSSIIIALLC